MDWFNSNFYRDWGYGLIYPQLFPHLKRENPVVQDATVAWGKEKSKSWLQILKARPSYAKVYEVFNGFVASTKGQPFQAI
jgi:glutathione S-transferase